MNFLQELQDWCDKHDRQQMGSKALRVYNKCMLRGKVYIAKRIEQKYRRQFPQSDMAVAFGMALLAAKNVQPALRRAGNRITNVQNLLKCQIELQKMS